MVAEASPTASPEPRRGDRVGRFELIRELARGGMGRVFVARDTTLGRKVAIKFLLDTDDEFAKRFLVEARATARCMHDNIITIHEVGEHAGLPYMVLELLEGRTLSAVFEDQPPVKQIVELVLPIVRALDRAHRMGIVHRDLKPTNVFVTERGQVKVLDFGIARMLDRYDAADPRLSASLATVDPDSPAMELTGANSFVGTIPYMSPEQWGVADVDHQTDLWQIGILMWRGLTRAHPVRKLTPDALHSEMRALDRPLRSITHQDPQIPPALAAIVDRCLAKKKQDRYANATDLAHDLQQFLTPLSPAVTEEACPYPGLQAFGEADAKYFFGRADEVRSARTQLARAALVAVIGPSGAGKSSFVHAGLVPSLRSSEESWGVAVVRPGRSPLMRLAVALAALATPDRDSPEFIGQLREAPGFFGVLLRRVAAQTSQHILVVVDQLEELFTLCDDPGDRALFLAALLSAADDPAAPVRVVVTLRADFLDRFAPHPAFLDELTRSLFFLSAPDPTRLREIIVRPAELVGYRFESASIVDDMLRVASGRGALPLLSFAALRLWETRDPKKRVLTAEGYAQIGGVVGAFARHADKVAAAVTPAQAPLLRAIMLRLVTADATRAVIEKDELLSIGDSRADVERILDQLAHGRLVQVHADAQSGTTVEIVHEMLISEWPVLVRWLEENHALRGLLDELRHAARQWMQRDCSPDLVWRGAPARDALAQLDRNVLDLAASERAYISAMRTAVRRERRRRLFMFVGIGCALALVALGASIAAVRVSLAEREAQQNADTATSALRAAETAKADLQRQLDVIAEKERARLEATAARDREEQRRTQVESSLVAAQASGLQTREELAAANQELARAAEELKRKVSDAERAQQKAQAAEAAAREASAAARAATAKTEQLLERERKERKELQDRLKKIDDRRLE